jgi:transposase-like protein
MVDTNDDTRRVRGRVQIRTGVIRRRRWTAEEKGRIVAEAILPDAVIADVARRHDLAPQHLSNWIRAAKDGRFALPAQDDVALCRSSQPAIRAWITPGYPIRSHPSRLRLAPSWCVFQTAPMRARSKPWYAQ